MKYNLLYIFTSLLLLSSCTGDDSLEEDSLTPVHTTIVYMMAENSLSSYAVSDIEEMLEGSEKSVGNDNLVVYVDRAGSSLDSLPCMFNIRKGVKYDVQYLPESNSCDGGVFSSVLQKVRKEYPSQSYSLVMWSHGSGWLPGQAVVSRSIGIDNNINTSSDEGFEMEIPSMREAIEVSGLHFRWILFDACYMQCIEVAYELKDVTDYVIASPTEIPGNGAPYSVIVPNFSLGDSEKSARMIAEGFYDYYRSSTGLLLSVIRTACLDSLADATSSCFDSVPDVDDTDSLQSYGPWSYKYYWRTEYFDMGSLMHSRTDSAHYSMWRRQLEEAVPFRYHTKEFATSYNLQATVLDEETYSGVSMFLPARRYVPYGYNDAVKSARWWQRVFSDKPSSY